MATTASFDAQFLNIPIRTLLINEEPIPVVVREATITRGTGVHDSASLSIVFSGGTMFEGNIRIPIDSAFPAAGTRDIRVDSLAGQPIRFAYGIAPQVEEFYGYISSFTPDQKFKQGLNFVVNMVGATFSMQRVSRLFYTNITAAELVKRCADRCHIGSDIDATTYRWPSVGMAKSTDWQASKTMAKLSGRILLNWNGVLRMKDPVELFRQYPYAFLVSTSDLLESEKKLLDFSPTESSPGQISSTPREFFFFDPNGTVVSHKQATDNLESYFVAFSDMPVHDRDEAENYEMSSIKDIDRWLQRATARIRGDASIYPGMIVNINTGANESSAKFNGRWLVLEVKHSMKRDAYNTELRLYRQGSSIPVATSLSFEHFWRSYEKPQPVLILRNKEWLSSWAEPFVEVRT